MDAGRRPLGGFSQPEGAGHGLLVMIGRLDALGGVLLVWLSLEDRCPARIQLFMFLFAVVVPTTVASEVNLDDVPLGTYSKVI